MSYGSILLGSTRLSLPLGLCPRLTNLNKGKETRRIETKDRDDSRVDVPAPAVVFIITFLPIAPRRRPPTLDPENESSAGMNGLLSSE